MPEPLPQERHLPDEHRLHARLMEALMCEVNVTVYDEPVPPPTREQFLATLLAVVTQIAAYDYGANRPTFAESPWQPQQPGVNELLTYHLLLNKLENKLVFTPPNLGFRDEGTAAWHRDIYLRILASEHDFNLLVKAGYVTPSPTDARYYRYSYTPHPSQS